MDSVVDKLAEIEAAAEAIVESAHAQKSDIEKELQREREDFDRETEKKTLERLSALRQENDEKMNVLLKEQREKNSSAIDDLKKDFEENHAAYAGQILKNIIEV
ncbi:MAG: hypothetical protein K1W34_13400 [Lachnospiraceae bacterium]